MLVFAFSENCLGKGGTLAGTFSGTVGRTLGVTLKGTLLLGSGRGTLAGRARGALTAKRTLGVTLLKPLIKIKGYAKRSLN